MHTSLPSQQLRDSGHRQATSAESLWIPATPSSGSKMNGSVLTGRLDQRFEALQLPALCERAATLAERRPDRRPGASVDGIGDLREPLGVGSEKRSGYIAFMYTRSTAIPELAGQLALEQLRLVHRHLLRQRDDHGAGLPWSVMYRSSVSAW